MEQLLSEFSKRNIKVVFLELNFWSGLLLYLKKQQKWLCVINSLNEPSAQQWTLAHELAHFLLHPNSRSVFTDGIFFCGLSDMEWQANRMAAEMLMPKKSLLDMVNLDRDSDLSSIKRRVEQKAHQLNVPTSALTWWLFELGYLNRRVYSELRS